MYKDGSKPASILIVKTSSLGDIIQSFNVLDEIKRRFPEVAIDWAVETPFYQVVASHPLIRRAISLRIKGDRDFLGSIRDLQKDKYDLVFDLQGNCKSGIITFLSRGKIKIGYGLKSVREWPNILATDIRFDISKQKNIRHFYLELIERYFGKQIAIDNQGVRFKLEESEREKLSALLDPIGEKFKIMVCPGSKWINKQVKLETLALFLQRVKKGYDAHFFLVWGDESERVFCNELQSNLGEESTVVDKLPIPTWQNLINEMSLVIAVDSSALHLCGTTSTPSFSIFGPTSPEVFKPLGKKHFAFQGACPYNRTFEKQCPVLRSCPTGACIRDLKAEDLFSAFTQCTAEIFQNQRASLQP